MTEEAAAAVEAGNCKTGRRGCQLRRRWREEIEKRKGIWVVVVVGGVKSGEEAAEMAVEQSEGVSQVGRRVDGESDGMRKMVAKRGGRRRRSSSRRGMQPFLWRLCLKLKRKADDDDEGRRRRRRRRRTHYEELGVGEENVGGFS